MTHPYVEISYRRGKPFVGYLYLDAADEVTKSVRRDALVLDFDGAGKLVGIEILAFTAEAVASLRAELASRQIDGVTEAELRPLIAA